VMILVKLLVIRHVIDFSMEVTTQKRGLAWQMMDWVHCGMGTEGSRDA